MKHIQLDHSKYHFPSQKFPLCFLLDNIHLSANIGSLFRIADALGVEKIYLTGLSSVSANTKFKKASRSTEKFVDYAYEENTLDLAARLKNEGYCIIGLEITSSSISIQKMSFAKDQKICLVIGSEDIGVSQNLLEACDSVVHIPMFGQNSSMNVGTACAIATFEIIRNFKIQD
jgi:tRNA G18 (ribose-2'-O)-methylase SpoU